jgi:hypothetical protein
VLGHLTPHQHLQASYASPHQLRVSRVIKKGVDLVIVGILTLLADSIANFRGANDSYGYVESFHLYELLQHSNTSYHNLLARIIEMKQSMSSKHPCCRPHNLAHITPIFATLITLSVQAPYPC